MRRLLLLFCAAACWGQERIARETPVERDIQAGEKHHYLLRLDRDQMMAGSAAQIGIDVIVALIGPDNRLLIQTDRPVEEGAEEFVWIAAEPGDYTIEIRPKGQPPPGRYRLNMTASVSPGPEDRSRFAAFQVLWGEVNPLYGQDSGAALKEAASKLEASMPQWKSSGDLRGEAYAWQVLGSIYGRLGLSTKMRDALETALPLIRRLPNRGAEARTLNSLATAYQRVGDTRRGLEMLQQSLALRRQLGDRNGEGIVLNNIGLAQDRLGEPKEALESYLQSLAIRRETGDRSGEATVLGNMSLTYQRLGQFQKALEVLVDALPLRRAAGDRRGESSTLNALGNAYSAVGDIEKAQEYWKLAEPLFRQNGDIQGLAAVLGNLGNASRKLGRNQEAVSYHERDLELRRQGGNRQGEVYSLISLCATLGNLGELSKARERAEEAVAISKQIDFKAGLGQALNCLGQTHVLLSDAGKGRGEIREAAEVLRASGDVEVLPQVLGKSAELEAEAGNLAEALERSEEALRILEVSRAAVAAPDLRASYRALNAKQYALNVDLLMRMHAADPNAGFAVRAFEASERARARSLIEMMSDAPIDFREELTAAQRLREDQILQRIRSGQRELFRGTTTTERKRALDAQISSAERDLDLFQIELRRAGSRYASVQYAPTLGLDGIRSQLLGSDAALVEYALGEKRSFVWAISARGFAGAVLPGRPEIERQVAAHRKQLAQRVSALTADAAIAGMNQQSSALYRVLLAPVEPALSGARKLIVVPDGDLAYLPFETLNGETPLIERFAISYAPSASALAVLKERVEPGAAPARMLLAFADPETGPAISAHAESAERGLDLARLPNAQSEVNAISGLYRPGQFRIYSGSGATEQALKSEDLGAYRYLHFATHGYFDEEKPLRSGLVLAPGAKADEDGVLQAGEIMNLRLRTDLVTLSACQTGLGKVLAGEGVLGLTRAFLHAGARSVVVSLWNVNDAATSQLMKEFYAGLSRGISREDALREAKLALLHGSQRAWRRPYFWAPFVLTGDPGSGAKSRE